MEFKKIVKQVEELLRNGQDVTIEATIPMDGNKVYTHSSRQYREGEFIKIAELGSVYNSHIDVNWKAKYPTYDR